MVAPFLRIKSHGPLILSSNFWDLPEAKLGKLLVSCNAGAFRVLVPVAAEVYLDDMRTAKGCAVSRGPWSAQGLSDAFEILFDDGTTDPFALHLAPESFVDTFPTAQNTAGEWVLSCWTRPRRGRPHKALERPCRYRIAVRIPYLRPWSEP
jgi:hypothetical protein